MTASAGSGARARRSGSRPPCSRRAALSDAAGAVAGAWLAGAWLAGAGVAAAWVQAPTANSAASPRARTSCVNSSCVAPLLSIVSQPTSVPVTAAGFPLAVRDRGVSRAITSSRCTGGRLDEGPALVALPGRHLPSGDRRCSGRPAATVAAERARITAPHPPASASGGRRWTTSGGSASRASSRAGPELVEGAQDRGEERLAGAGDAAAEHDAPDVVGHDQLVDRAGDPAARGVGDLEGEGVAGGGLAVDVDGGDRPVRRGGSSRHPPRAAASARTPDGATRGERLEAAAQAARAARGRRRRGRRGRSRRPGRATPRWSWPSSTTPAEMPVPMLR